MIYILSAKEAVKFKPTNTTYVIRIQYPDPSEHEEYQSLTSSMYVEINTYYFADVDLDQHAISLSESVFAEVVARHTDDLITHEIARKIISDFKSKKDQCEDILIHCFAGVRRSPSVAIALKDIFNLGESSDVLKTKHFAYDHYIYRIMLEASEML